MHDVRHIVRLRERRDNDAGNANAVAVVRARDALDVDTGRDVVGLDRRRRWYVVVIAAVLVVRVDQHGLRPLRSVHRCVDDLGRDRFTRTNVLRVLFRLGLEVRVDKADGRELARGGVLVELVDAHEVLRAAGDALGDDRDAGKVGVVVAPRDVVLFEAVHDDAVGRR